MADYFSVMKGTFVMLIRKTKRCRCWFWFITVLLGSLYFHYLFYLYTTAPPSYLKPQTQVGQEYALGLCDVLLLKGGVGEWRFGLFKYLLMCTQMPGAVRKIGNIKDRISRRSVLFTWEKI